MSAKKTEKKKAVKKAPAKESAPKKSVKKKAVKKTSAEKSAPKKTVKKKAVKKTPAEKSAPKKTVKKKAVKKTPAKESAPKKSVKKKAVKKTPAKKSAPKKTVKKKAVKKTPAKESAPKKSVKKKAVKRSVVEAPSEFDTVLKKYEMPAAEAEKIREQEKMIFPEPEISIPSNYGVDRMVLLPRDPEWAFVYWEVTEGLMETVKNSVGADKLDNARRVLRIYDINGVDFNGNNANSFFDIEVAPFAGSWYLKMPSHDCSYIAELGFLTDNGMFIKLLRSNRIELPRATFSEDAGEDAEEWMTVNYGEILRMSGGGESPGSRRQGSEFIGAVPGRELNLSSGSLYSGSLSSGSQQGGGDSADFFLKVGTELIVYGATKPDASLTFEGRPVKLREDGTFSFRFALPDSFREMPVEAVSSDAKFTRKITPVVEKKTVYG